VVGEQTHDRLLADKETVASALSTLVSDAAAAIGVKVLAVGIKDVILPGEMKALMNKVTEARKAAEAALITRREETAAMRSQANTARLIADSPSLLRLRELEALERIAATTNLQVLVGEKGVLEQISKIV